MARYSDKRRQEIEIEKEKLYKWFDDFEKDFPFVSISKLLGKSGICTYTNFYNARHYEDKKRELSVTKLNEIKQFIVDNVADCYKNIKK